MLAGLASAYVDAINKGAVPTISTAWQARTRAPLALASVHATVGLCEHMAGVPPVSPMIGWLACDVLLLTLHIPSLNRQAVSP